eukprot:11964027-Alexandrium_andersonii.AAC.1
MVARGPSPGGASLLSLYGALPRGVWPAAGRSWVPPPREGAGVSHNAEWRCSRCDGCQRWCLRLVA